MTFRYRNGGNYRAMPKTVRRWTECGPLTETAVIEFQQGASLTPDGVVGPLTWQALPDGGPVSLLAEGSTGDVVADLQSVLTNGAPGQWGTTPQGIDRDYGPAPSWWHSGPGAGSALTGWSVTRPGRSRCMRRVPRWSQPWA